MKLAALRPGRPIGLRTAVPAVLALAALGIPSALEPSPLLVWNLTASAPPGLYRVKQRERFLPGDMVIAKLRPRMRDIAAARGYLPASVPLVKKVAATGGDRICASGRQVTVNGRLRAIRLAKDARHRPLPWWTGCRTLKAGEYLLLNQALDSFDGRYFGWTPGALILGKATLLWRG